MNLKRIPLILLKMKEMKEMHGLKPFGIQILRILLGEIGHLLSPIMKMRALMMTLITPS